MNKFFLCVIIFLYSTNNLIAQDLTKEFELTQPESITQNSLYNSIELIDSRTDTSFGFVQLGAFNRKAILITNAPIEEQIQKILAAATDASAKNGKLLFQLRRFSFRELTNATNERGYCYLRAILYQEKDSKFQQIPSI